MESQHEEIPVFIKFIQTQYSLKMIIRNILKTAIILLYVFLNLNYNSVCEAQKNQITPEVDYIRCTPIIDGRLDENLKLLPIRELPMKIDLFLFKSFREANYRMAYTVDFLYLYMEGKADSITCKDRGYQNGDGAIFLLADGTEGGKLTNKFYVYGFSPQEIEEQKWAEKIIWYKDNVTELKRLTEDVKTKFAEHNGVISFELLLPWQRAYPFHPWDNMVIGTNLWFLKAFSNRSIPIVRGLFWDFSLPSESSGRKYLPLVFEKPDTLNEKLYWRLSRRNYFENDTVEVIFFDYANRQINKRMKIFLLDKEGKEVYHNYHELKYDVHIQSNYITLNFPEVKPGLYTIKVESPDVCSLSVNFSVLPEINISKIKEDLFSLKDKILPGDYNCLLYYCNEAKSKLQNLNKHYIYDNLSEEIGFLNQIVTDYINGEQDLLTLNEDHRRAFFSGIDSTLRPYSIKLPDNYDPSKTYPLMVFLHGSGRTDLNALKNHKYIVWNDFICIAPNGRGISNYYGTPESQMDINEAIDDVIGNFKIDTGNIFLSGFSMGGYGVYRTFYENPQRYKAIAIIAGEPKINIFMKKRGGAYPNFLKHKYIRCFKDIPIFIYHGVNDLNCPYHLTQKMIKKLERIGADITKDIYTGYGHSVPSGSEFARKFDEWIKTCYGRWDL